MIWQQRQIDLFLLQSCLISAYPPKTLASCVLDLKMKLSLSHHFLNPCALSPSPSLSLKFAPIIYIFHRKPLFACGPPAQLVPLVPFLLIMGTCTCPSPPPTQPLCDGHGLLLVLNLSSLLTFASFSSHNQLLGIFSSLSTLFNVVGRIMTQKRLDTVKGFSMLTFFVNEFISTPRA